MELDYSYHWFILFCETEGLDPDNIIVKLSLDRARGYAYEMKWWQNQVDIIKRKPYDNNGHWLFHKKTKDNAQRMFEQQVKDMNQKRIECMIEAVEVAQATRGLDEEFTRYLEYEYTKDGLEIPKF